MSCYSYASSFYIVTSCQYSLHSIRHISNILLKNQQAFRNILSECGQSKRQIQISISWAKHHEWDINE